MELGRLTRRDRWTWRRIALPVSLILNLFFLAVICGHVWQNHRNNIADARPLARALANAEAMLPPKDAAAFRAVLRADAPRYEAAADRLRDAREALNRRIAATAFDPAAVRQALTAWEMAWSRFLGDFSEPLIDALAQVSPEGRRQLIADRRSERLQAPAP